ncbi:MAG: hypothetical protein K0U29_06260 [Gammaproteobacteria bacterium]|nr:hypothetical protein [Gammaproteobacteria bacterium]
MIGFDNIVKAWNTGQYLGDRLFGNATALPGFILDGLVNVPLSAENRYDFTNIDLFTEDALRHMTFSSLFAVPGKLIGNTVVPLVFTVVTMAALAPHMIIRLVDKSYQKIVGIIDQITTYLAQLSGFVTDYEWDNPPHMDKVLLSGYQLLGSLSGAITSLVGAIVDGMALVMGVDTNSAATKLMYTVGKVPVGIVGGLITGVIGFLVYPVKQLLDGVFGTYRGFRNTLDKMAAYCVAKNGCSAEARVHAGGHRIFSAGFREKIGTSREQTSIAQFLRWLLRPRPITAATALARHTTPAQAAGRQKLIAAAAKQVTETAASAVASLPNNEDSPKDFITLEPLNSTAVIICENKHSVNKESAGDVKTYGKCPCCRKPLLDKFTPNQEVIEQIKALSSAAAPTAKR